MRVDVDRQMCDGTGFCVRIAPQLFALDQGLACVVQEDVPAGLEDLAREAEAACPTAAIRAE